MACELPWLEWPVSTASVCTIQFLRSKFNITILQHSYKQLVSCRAVIPENRQLNGCVTFCWAMDLLLSPTHGVSDLLINTFYSGAHLAGAYSSPSGKAFSMSCQKDLPCQISGKHIHSSLVQGLYTISSQPWDRIFHYIYTWLCAILPALTWGLNVWWQFSDFHTNVWGGKSSPAGHCLWRYTEQG